MNDLSRRSFVKGLAYVAPAILTLKAVPAFASHGSARGDESGSNTPFTAPFSAPFSDSTPQPQQIAGPQNFFTPRDGQLSWIDAPSSGLNSATQASRRRRWWMLWMG